MVSQRSIAVDPIHSNDVFLCAVLYFQIFSAFQNQKFAHEDILV